MQNETLIREQFAVIDTADWDRLNDIFSPAVVYCRPGYEDIVGIDALLDFYKNVRIIAAGKHDILGIMTDSSTGCCWGRFEGQSRSGEELAEYFADWYDVDDGFITHRRTFFYRPAV